MVDDAIRALERRLEAGDESALEPLNIARIRAGVQEPCPCGEEGCAKERKRPTPMPWDKPEIELEDMTREQLIAHCKKQAKYDQRWNNDREDAKGLQRKIDELEHDNYQMGYVLDKIWHGLTEYGRMDPKTDTRTNPRVVVNCFWSIVSKMKNALAQQEQAKKAAS